MRRIAAVAFATLLLSVALYAESSDRTSYRVARSLRGLIVPNPRDTSDALLISPQTIWSSTQFPLSRFHDGLPRPVNGIDGAVIGVAYWNDRIVVARLVDSALQISLYDAQLQTIVASATVRELRDFFADPAARFKVMPIGALDASAILLVGDKLFRFDLAGNGTLGLLPIAEDVRSTMYHAAGSASEVAYLYGGGDRMFMSIIDSSLSVVTTAAVPRAQTSRIDRIGNTIAIVSDISESGGSSLTLIDRRTAAMSSRMLPVPARQVALASRDEQAVIAVVTTRTGRPEIVAMRLDEQSDVLPEGHIIAGDFGSPLFLTAAHDTVYVVFSGGLATAKLDGTVLSRDVFAAGFNVDDLTRVGHGQRIILHNGALSTILDRSEHPLWFVFGAFDLVLRYVVPGLLISSLLVVWVLNRRQRRILDAIIDSPAMGLVFTIDNSGKLLRVNERAAALLRITPNVPMGRHFRAYMQQAGMEELTSLLDAMQLPRSESQRRIGVGAGDDAREYIFSSTPLIGLTGSSRGSIITGIDITETLESRRLVNWAQLAHDMQTNLSTIRLNAEQITNSDESSIVERRRRILFQVGVLIDRVRDLLSIGRTDEIVREAVHSAELCTEVRHEFDQEMFPHVQFVMKLRGTMMNVDRMKISRAVRNAVENAIKALKGQPGTIEMSTWHDRTNVFISVSDTGVGMDPETMANMMKPYFSTAQDGSGHGIGTMIMHHVMKLHGGAIRVTSEPGKGTQVVFRIPHEMDPKDVIRIVNSGQRSL